MSARRCKAPREGRVMVSEAKHLGATQAPPRGAEILR
jgi:hypothetical protein